MDFCITGEVLLNASFSPTLSSFLENSPHIEKLTS